MRIRTLLAGLITMLGSVFAKALRDRTVATLVVAATLLTFAGFSMGIYAGFGTEASQLLEGLPDAIAALYGSNDGTLAGMVTGALFGLMGPMVLLAYAIAAGSSAASGEEKHHTLDLLLANPVSRTRVLLAKSAVLALGVLTIAGLLWVGGVAIASVVSLDISGQDFFAASLQLAGLGLMFGFLTLAISSWSNGTIGAAVSAGLAGVSYLATSLFPIEPALADYAQYTPWYLYSGHEPLTNGVDLIGLVAMLAISGLLLLIAVVGFNRRDLRE